MQDDPRELSARKTGDGKFNGLDDTGKFEVPEVARRTPDPRRKWPDLGPLREYSPQYDAEEFKNLETKVPMLLFPVRLETRLSLIKGEEKLRLRIYPDQINVTADDGKLTAVESAAGQHFWRQIEGVDRATQIAAAEQLIATVGGARAAHTAEETDPDRKVDEDIPIITRPPEDPEPRPYLTCLPKRWIAVGYVLDQLAFVEASTDIIHPLSTAISTEDGMQAGAPVTKDGAWMVDFQKAKDKGMAMEITLGALELAAGELTSLIVFGVNGAIHTEEVSEMVGDLLAWHERSSGLGFLPQGMPTNNTKDELTDWSRRDLEPAHLLDTLLDQRKAAPRSVLGQTQKALGLGAIPALGRAPHADHGDRDLSSAMNTVLFEAVLGTFARTLLPLRDKELDYYDLHPVREWVRDHLCAGAPVSTLRVGPQPYGILPVYALPEPQNLIGPAKTVAGFIERVVMGLRADFSRALDSVPLLDPNAIDRAAAEARPASAIPALLASQPYPARLFWREAASGSGSWQDRFDTEVARIADQNSDLYDMMAGRLGVLDRQRNIDRQLALIAGVYRTIQNSGRGNAWKRRMRADLNRLMAVVGQFEQRQRPLKWLDLPHFAGRLTYATSAYLENIPGETATEIPPDQFVNQARDDRDRLESAAYLSRLGNAVAANQRTKESPPDFLCALIKSSVEVAKGADKARFSDALELLSKVDDPALLERLGRETLGLGSHRLDAWFSSLANQRLHQIRQDPKTETGLTLGAYGWVTDLKFTPKGGSAGFLHAPSLSQAATAAVMRSGWLAHGGKEATGPGAVSANSARLRLAHEILDGIRNGQPLGRLLGYRFERALREDGLGGLIRDARRFVISATDSDATPDEPVDGERLLTLMPAGAPYLGPFADNADLAGALEDLRTVFDAVQDVALLEGTHAAAEGRSAHATAVFEAVNQGTRLPPEFDAHKAPRGGTTIDHRAVMLFQPPDENWKPKKGWRSGQRDQLMPELERFLQDILPLPSRIGFSVAGQRLTLAKLGLSACDAVFLMGDDPSQMSPALVTMALDALGEGPEKAPQAEGDPTGGRSKHTLEEVQLMVYELRATFDHAEPLTAEAFGPRGTLLRPARDTTHDDILTRLEADLKSAVDTEDLRALALFGYASGPPEARQRQADAALAAADNAPTASNKARALFGRKLPLTTLFEMPETAVTFPSDLAQAATAEVLQKVGAVRPILSRLATASTLGQMIGAPTLPLHAGQSDYTAGEGWVATSRPQDDRARLSVLACGPKARPKKGTKLAGLMLDQWSERVPARDQLSGVAIQFDAPSTRPPQTLLLATAPRSIENWRMRTLAQVLFDTLEFAALRMVAPEDLTDFGAVLPTIHADFDPDGFTDQETRK